MDLRVRAAPLLVCLVACEAGVPPPSPVVLPPPSSAPLPPPPAPSDEAPPANGRAVPDPSSAEFETEIRAFEEWDRAHAPKPGGIVFVGSSSIRRWSTLERDFPRHRVMNRGFGGSRIRNVVDYADRIVTPYAPRLVVFFAGSNDIHAGASAAEVLSDFQAFVARVTRAAPEVRIAFVSITTSPSRFAEVGTVREANRLVKEAVAKTPRLVFIDVFSHMVDAAGAPLPELYGEDKLHLNAKGYALWVELIGPYLGPEG